MKVRARIGSSVQEFLCAELGIAPDVVRDRVSTVFLNGKVVDVLESALIQEDSVLALSAALPGLVGATFRRGGYYSAMREGISLSPTLPTADAPQCQGFVQVKLFNLLIEELGPALLRRGIIVPQQEANQLLQALGRADRAGEPEVLLHTEAK